ncbi:MAG TPA: acyl-CoA carboxylase subunit beta [Candidatus Dormibacteraeota bacterium]
MSTQHERAQELAEKARRGGQRYLPKLREQNKLTVRERLDLLLDAGSWVEDGLYANALADDLPADGVVTGLGQIAGRTAAIMANDPTVKAGSWGARTVEKIIRIQEAALRLRVPLLYLVDSAGARITDQIEMFPGRRHAGRIFFNEVQMSGVVPQICLLFGPSAAGGAYIPAFCDVVIMVEGNASMYLGSPRMVEVVVGEKVTLEELGGARMHCTDSGCGDFLVKDDGEAIEVAKRYFGYFPQNFRELPAIVEPRDAAAGRPLVELVPTEANRGYDMRKVIQAIVDEGSWLEVKQLFAKELLVGLARLGGRAVGILANQPMQKGGVLFNDSSDKAARFIWLCDAFNIPLLFLADVPGFMIGTDVERRGIIRHGAKMITAVSEATVPRISVIVRKAYGAGLYAMSGPAFDPDCTLALPSAQIAVMGPAPAVNAVFYNKLMELPEGPDRDARRAELEAEYNQDVDLFKLASNLIVDQVVAPEDLRAELIARFGAYATRYQPRAERKHGVPPV